MIQKSTRDTYVDIEMKQGFVNNYRDLYMNTEINTRFVLDTEINKRFVHRYRNQQDMCA